MDREANFTAELARELEQRGEYLEKRQLPRLREQLHVYQTGLHTVITVLLRKALIKEDPYRRDQKISEVVVPPDGAVTESEKVDRISERLSAFELQLDFVNSLYQFNVEFLSLARIGVLAKLVRYIAWDKVPRAAGGVNSRVLAELLSKVAREADPLSRGIVRDAVAQLEKATGEILRILRDLAAFHRTSYKLSLRKHLIEGLRIGEESVRSNREGLLKALRVRFGSVMANREPGSVGLCGYPDGIPYYPELAGEVLDEDFGPGGEALRRAALAQIQVREERPAKKPPESYKPLLIEAVRLLSAAAGPLEAGIQKLGENAQALESRKVGFRRRFARWLRKLFGVAEGSRVYSVEIVDPATSARRVEEIDFKSYVERALRRWRVLANMSSKTGLFAEKLAGSPEKQLVEFLDLNLSDLRGIVSKLEALDGYFKARLPQALRPRGVKLEISAVTTAIIKANQELREYLSRVEEIDQMKRLGIDVGAD